MKQVKALLLLAVCFCFLGTTYVIKQGGREVGKYVEDDGKTDVVDLNNAAPNPQTQRPRRPAAPLPAVKNSAADSGANLQAQALKLAAEVKKKNDDRKKETEQAVAEMEGGHPQS